MKLIITQNVFGEIVRAGLYDDRGKWIKWISKKEINKYVDIVDEVENKNI